MGSFKGLSQNSSPYVLSKLSAHSPLGVCWEFAGSPLEVCWESAGSPLGIRWEPLGVRWEFIGSPLAVCWELEVRWEFTKWSLLKGSPNVLSKLRPFWSLLRVC